MCLYVIGYPIWSRKLVKHTRLISTLQALVCALKIGPSKPKLQQVEVGEMYAL